MFEDSGGMIQSLWPEGLNFKKVTQGVYICCMTYHVALPCTLEDIRLMESFELTYRWEEIK